MELNERLDLLIRILDPEDYRYIGAHDLRAEAQFRRERLRIYRSGLRELSSGIVRSYQARLANMNAAGQWTAYPRLAWSTAATLMAIGKLWMAGSMFRFRLPLLVNVAAQRDRLQRFLTVETPSAEPGTQPF